MRHKHADVLIAIAEGKPIQFLCRNNYNQDCWNDLIDVNKINPLSSPLLTFRIKPTPLINIEYYKRYMTACYPPNNHGYQAITPTSSDPEWDLKITIVDGEIIKVDIPSIDESTESERELTI